MTTPTGWNTDRSASKKRRFFKVLELASGVIVEIRHLHAAETPSRLLCQ